MKGKYFLSKPTTQTVWYGFVSFNHLLNVMFCEFVQNKHFTRYSKISCQTDKKIHFQLFSTSIEFLSPQGISSCMLNFTGLVLIRLSFLRNCATVNQRRLRAVLQWIYRHTIVLHKKCTWQERSIFMRGLLQKSLCLVGLFVEQSAMQSCLFDQNLKCYLCVLLFSNLEKAELEWCWSTPPPKKKEYLSSLLASVSNLNFEGKIFLGNFDEATCSIPRAPLFL